jgi:hypothetical protein
MKTSKQLTKKEKSLEKKEDKLEEKEEEIKEELSRLKKLKIKARESSKKFKSEIKKSTHTAIVAAFSFVIALVWKDVIVDFVNNISNMDASKGNLFAAIFVTIICVFGIIIITKFLSEE